MNSPDLRKSMTSDQGTGFRKRYLAPGFKRLSPEAAKESLLQGADTSDPEVQHMLDCIEKHMGEKGS
jgi:hypothetical protein